MRLFDFLDLKGKVSMENPDVTFWILCDYGDVIPAPDYPKRIFFGRQVRSSSSAHFIPFRVNVESNFVIQRFRTLRVNSRSSIPSRSVFIWAPLRWTRSFPLSPRPWLVYSNPLLNISFRAFFYFPIRLNLDRSYSILLPERDLSW